MLFRLTQLICDSPTSEGPAFADAPVTNSSPSVEKIGLFRRLFAGRPDVFPVRWENKNTGRSGFSPACTNEWVKGICGKPKVKCGECPHQAFMPPSADIIENHLRGGDARSGDFVAGVYPLLQDETCWFLAADFDKESWANDAQALLAQDLLADAEIVLAHPLGVVRAAPVVHRGVVAVDDEGVVALVADQDP